MLDLLSATAALSVLVSLLLLALVGLTVVPFVVACDAAEARGRAPERAGALALAGVGLGLALAVLVQRSDLPTPAALLPLLLCWAVPLAVRLGLAPAAVLGRRAVHQ